MIKKEIHARQLGLGPEVSGHDTLPQLRRYDGILINVPIALGGRPDEGEYPAFGLGRIAATMWNNYGLSCGIIDAQQINKGEGRMDLSELMRQIKLTNPTVVGLNPTSINFDVARSIADALEEYSIPYVLGGYFATLAPEFALKIFPQAAAIVCGKGEIAMSKITAVIKEGGMSLDSANIDGVYTATHTPSKTRTEELGDTEWPDVDPALYYYHPFEESEKNGRKIVKARLYETEGCPYRCGFCSSCAIHKQRYRRPSMNQIVNDVERVIHMGANRVHFLDDLLLAKPEHVFDFLKEIKKRNLHEKFDWQGMSRANLIAKWDNEVLDALKDSGCFHIAFGVESGSENILKKITKGISPDEVLTATRRLAERGIGVKGFFILGFPDETEEEMQETIHLALRMAEEGATHISLFQFQPYPGTALYEEIMRTKPEVLKELGYYDKESIYTSGKLRTAAYLPDSIQLSKVLNSRIRDLIPATTAEFYRRVEKRKTKLG